MHIRRLFRTAYGPRLLPPEPLTWVRVTAIGTHTIPRVIERDPVSAERERPASATNHLAWPAARLEATA
jgi:hypothetical protein